MMGENLHPQVELISFQNPTEARLFLPSISSSKSESELQHQLLLEFSTYGLVHHIYCYRKRESDSMAAFVELYSEHSRDQAIAALDNELEIEGHKVRVLQSRRQRETSLPLSLHKCEALANFYFGFDNWSTELLYQEPEDAVLGADGKSITQSFCSVVRIRVHLEGHPVQQVEGVGMTEATFFSALNSEEETRSRANAFCECRKKSRGVALQNAFAKLIIVVVDGRKVGVEVDHGQVDPVPYDPLWEKHELDEFSGTTPASWPFDETNLRSGTS